MNRTKLNQASPSRTHAFASLSVRERHFVLAQVERRALGEAVSRKTGAGPTGGPVVGLSVSPSEQTRLDNASQDADLASPKSSRLGSTRPKGVHPETRGNTHKAEEKLIMRRDNHYLKSKMMRLKQRQGSKPGMRKSKVCKCFLCRIQCR